MFDYKLYYWDVPFRGQFVRAILAYAGKTWEEFDTDAITDLMQTNPDRQPVPFMGPPVLIDTATGFALSQMPAIAVYLGARHDLIPEAEDLRALTAKVVNDANDVIDELTLDGGRDMWTPESWETFQPRLQRWMLMWEAMLTHNNAHGQDAFLLGTYTAGVADIVTSTLWSTLGDHFPSIGKMLEDVAPRTARLSKRLQETPALHALKEASDRAYGGSYCGGEIEKSLRAVAGG